MTRLLNQFLYGTFYLVILAAVGWGIYSFEFKPAPSCFDNQQNGGEVGVDCGGDCVACEIKNLRRLEVQSAQLFENDRLYSVSMKIHNPNETLGAGFFEYRVQFFDKDSRLLKEAKNNSFIYAGETKQIVEAGISVTNGFPSRAAIAINEETAIWVPAEEFSEPDYELKETSSVLEGNQAAVSGAIKNPNNFLIKKIEITAFLRDNFGARTGISKTELSNMEPFEERPFIIFIPVSKSLYGQIDLKATEVFAEILK